MYSPNPLLILGILSGAFILLSVAGWFLAFWHRRRLMARYSHDALQIPGPQSKYVTVNGVQLHYVVEGKGSDMLLIHGIGANLYCWRYMIPLLARSFRVWAVDLKGYGLSDKPRKSSYGLPAQADLLLKFIEQQRINKCILVGNSMGGAIAAEMTIRRPDLVSELVLLNSAHDPKIIGLLDLRKAKVFIDLLTPFVNKTLVKQVVKNLYGTKKEVSDEVVNAYLTPFMASNDIHHAFVASFEALADKNLVPRLQKLNRRVLLLWGKNDRLIPVRFGEQLHQTLTESQFHVHPEAGHHMQEEVPEWIVEKIEKFLASYTA